MPPVSVVGANIGARVSLNAEKRRRRKRFPPAQTKHDGVDRIRPKAITGSALHAIQNYKDSRANGMYCALT
jgi:hypothetical protein